MSWNPITGSLPIPVESSSHFNTTFLEDSSQYYPPTWISMYSVVSSAPVLSLNSLHIFNLSIYFVRLFHYCTFDKPRVIRYIHSINLESSDIFSNIMHCQISGIWTLILHFVSSWCEITATTLLLTYRQEDDIANLRGCLSSEYYSGSNRTVENIT